MGYEVLYNFISPVTGRILCDPTKVLVGDARGIAIPSTFIPIGALPDLPMGNIWIGNDMNRPTPNPTISLTNLPDLMNGNLWIGDGMNRPVMSKTITIDNLPNLSSGKVWIGNGMIPSRPIEGSPPQGPAGPPGPPGSGRAPPDNLDNGGPDIIGSLVKKGLQSLIGEGANLFFSFLGSAVGGFVVGAAGPILPGASKLTNATPVYNFAFSSLPGPPGAAGLSGKNTVFFNINFDISGGRIENIAPSPQADYDAVNAKWVWDLLNDNVEIVWAN